MSYVFVPPTFANYGKSTTDLFKKKFDFDPISIKSVRKAKGGLTVESGAVNTSTGSLRGYNKLSLTGASFGSSELELHTDAEQTSKISGKFTKLYPGFTLNVTAANKDKATTFKGANQVYSAEGTYARDNFASVVTLKASSSSNVRADVSISAGYENVSLGASSSFETASESATEPKDVNVGAEYTQDDLTVSLYTSIEKGTRFANGSIFHRVNRDLATGFLFKFNTVDSSSSVTTGADYRLDVDTVVKSKIELPKGQLQVALEYKLANPALTLNFASDFDVSNPQQIQSKGFGLGLSFGDN